MEARVVLEQARRAERQLRALAEKQRMCEALAGAGAAGKQLGALRAELVRRAEDWAGLQLRAAAAIDSIDDPVRREVLRYRYLDGLGWEEIASQMCYSKDWLWKVNRKALEALEAREA